MPRDKRNIIIVSDAGVAANNRELGTRYRIKEKITGRHKSFDCSVKNAGSRLVIDGGEQLKEGRKEGKDPPLLLRIGEVPLFISHRKGRF